MQQTVDSRVRFQNQDPGFGLLGPRWLDLIQVPFSCGRSLYIRRQYVDIVVPILRLGTGRGSFLILGDGTENKRTLT